YNEPLPSETKKPKTDSDDMLLDDKLDDKLLESKASRQQEIDRHRKEMKTELERLDQLVTRAFKSVEASGNPTGLLTILDASQFVQRSKKVGDISRQGMQQTYSTLLTEYPHLVSKKEMREI